jgi:GGDEF domain-containing protein
MDEIRFKCLVATGAEQGPGRLPAVLNAHEKLECAICRDLGGARAELLSRTAHALVLATNPGDPDPLLLLETVRRNPALAHMPVFVLDNASNPQIIRNCTLMGANAVIRLPGAGATNDDDYAMAAQIYRSLRNVYHPATRLQTGGAFMHRLEAMTQDVEKTRYLLCVKLHGLKSYNIYKSYDQGDAMLGAMADSIGELLAQRGNHNTVLGHLSSDKLCLITHDRRVESLCRTILHQSERIFRHFYTPFELMQGFITLEDNRIKGNYYLAETMIAGVEIPTQWNSHPVYLLDMLSELLRQVEKDESGYKIISL